MTRPSIRILIATLVAILASPAIAQSPALAASTVRLTGTVSDPGGYPLAGVTVQVVRADNEDSDIQASTTDKRGSFTSPRIPVNATTKYKLRVTDPTGRHQETYSKEFTATAANAKQNVTMADAAVIRGKIMTKDGNNVQPATHVLVTAFRATADGPENYANTGTSSGGAFSLGGLPSGTYSLLFEDADEDGTRVGSLFRSICYNNVPSTGGNCQGETKVVVKAGHVTTLNPQVMDSRIGQLSGAVTDRAGKGLANVTVSVYDAKDQSNWLGEVRTGAKGSWTTSIDFSDKVKLVAEDLTGTHRTTWYVKATSFTTGKALGYDGVDDIGDINIVLPLK